MSEKANKETIQRWIKEAWNRGHTGVAYEIFAPEYVAPDHEDPRVIIRGPRGIESFVIRFRKKHPKIHFTIDVLIAENNFVMGFFTVRGIGNDGVTHQAVDLWRFDDRGMIVERRFAFVREINRS